jgi:hypothetical protein
MGMKRLALNWCFTLWIEGGGKGKRARDAVRLLAQCIHGGVKSGRLWEAAQGRRWWCSPASVLKEEEEAGWA